MSSFTINVNSGVPQGCVLGPLLIFLFMHDHVATHSSNNIIKFCEGKLKEVPGWRIHLHHYPHEESREFSIRFLVVHITVLDTSRVKDQDSFSSSSEDSNMKFLWSKWEFHFRVEMKLRVSRLQLKVSRADSKIKSVTLVINWQRKMGSLQLKYRHERAGSQASCNTATSVGKKSDIYTNLDTRGSKTSITII